jgi:hypothetical protein
MIRKLLPVILALIGIGVGIGAGIALRPAPAPLTEQEAAAAAEKAKAELPPDQQPEFVKLNNQFIVPVVKDARVSAMVILALSLEVKTGMTPDIYAREPKLRDGFLQVLFQHANAGGFDGAFTDGDNLVLLRRALLESAQKTMGTGVSDVLISDIARQDS